MSKLRTIIRLYEDRRGLKPIAEMARTSRNTVKKYVSLWNSLSMSYEEFQHKSDAELNELFCISDSPAIPNPRMETLTALLPRISKELGKKGMTSQKQWELYKSQYPDGYALTQFRLAIQRYRMISNPSMRNLYGPGWASLSGYILFECRHPVSP